MKLQIRTRISENGRMVVPAPIRRALRIEKDEEVVLSVTDDEMNMVTLKSRLERARRRIRQYVKPGRSLSDELIAERREAAKRE